MPPPRRGGDDHRFIVGLDPDLSALQREPVVTVLDWRANAALVRAPFDQIEVVRGLFGGVVHVYETEQAARQTWGLFGPS